MGAGENTKIAALVDNFIKKLSEVADEEDWKESEGWVGKWSIIGDKGVTRIFEIREGKFNPCDEQEFYTGQVDMSDDTFLDLMDAALEGRGEAVFTEKYSLRAIRYRGPNWVVDSERFRKVLKRLGHKPVRSRQ